MAACKGSLPTFSRQNPSALSGSNGLFLCLPSFGSGFIAAGRRFLDPGGSLGRRYSIRYGQGGFVLVLFKPPNHLMTKFFKLVAGCQ